jgi:hypothetical protein
MGNAASHNLQWLRWQLWRWHALTWISGFPQSQRILYNSYASSIHPTIKKLLRYRISISAEVMQSGKQTDETRDSGIDRTIYISRVDTNIVQPLSSFGFPASAIAGSHCRRHFCGVQFRCIFIRAEVDHCPAWVKRGSPFFCITNFLLHFAIIILHSITI